MVKTEASACLRLARAAHEGKMRSHEQAADQVPPFGKARTCILSLGHMEPGEGSPVIVNGPCPREPYQGEGQESTAGREERRGKSLLSQGTV